MPWHLVLLIIPRCPDLKRPVYLDAAVLTLLARPHILVRVSKRAARAGHTQRGVHRFRTQRDPQLRRRPAGVVACAAGLVLDVSGAAGAGHFRGRIPTCCSGGKIQKRAEEWAESVRRGGNDAKTGFDCRPDGHVSTEQVST